MLKLLHQRNDDAVQFTDIKWASALLAERVQFVEEQNARCRFRKVEKLSKMNRSLSEIRSDHGVESHNVGRDAEFQSEGSSRKALSTPWRTMK